MCADERLANKDGEKCSRAWGWGGGGCRWNLDENGRHKEDKKSIEMKNRVFEMKILLGKICSDFTF